MIVWFLGSILSGDRWAFAQLPIERILPIDATNLPPPRTAWQLTPPPNFGVTNDAPTRFDSTQLNSTIPNQFQPLPNFDPFSSTTVPSVVQPSPAIAPSKFRLSEYKDTFFQKLSFSGTWIAGNRINGVEITELETSLTVAVPLPDVDRPMLITAGFETQFLEGPLTPDLPGQVYSAYTQFIWYPKITERLRGVFGIEPGFYGDFESNKEKIFRLLGRAFFRYDWIPDRLQIVGGVAYLDRSDFNVVPGGGVIWNPNDDWMYQLILPVPKIAYRFYWDGQTEYWAYLAGEIGGDSWGVMRAAGFADQLILIDYRTVLGISRNLEGGAGARIEFGYVFGRNAEYVSTSSDLKMDDAWMLRGVITF